MTNLDDVRAAMRPHTRLVWVETPSNPLMKSHGPGGDRGDRARGRPECDHRLRRHLRHAGPAAAARLRHRHGGALHHEVHRRPQRRGRRRADHAPRQLPVRARAQIAALRRRGAVAVRLLADAARHRHAAVPGARAFGERGAGRAVPGEHRAVEAVHYPGLPEHPGHEIAARQMSAFGGMLSFQVRGGREEAMGVAARCRLFIRATSLGGPHSLIEHRASVEGPQYADAAESAACFGRPGASGRSDRRSGAGARLRLGTPVLSNRSGRRFADDFARVLIVP